ncbi:MAG: adenylate/guanylate cyclase domain-containing protein [Solirubrobacterales bacterium]
MNDPVKDDAERKQVTVLFADVSGSMDLAEQEDPEAWREIMQRFFSMLADSVTRFEGTVDKFTGDGIMAIFGAPVAQEDHARRACYAALQMLDDVAEYAAELRREKGLNFSTRIGINSGEVVAGAIGGGGGSAYTAIGHTVGLAQRMEALAEPGKAYLTESTAELAHGYLDLSDLGEFEIKGASRPVQVFELAGVGQARSRLDLARERGFSQFVGRAAEIDRLEEALSRAKGGEATAIGVVAEPGIGKSRLYHEFAQRCRAEGLEVFEAQAQAHGKTIPFMPILQMLRSFYGIGDRDPEQTAREKIAGRSLLLDPGFAADLPLVFDFLGVPDPERPVPKMNPEGRGRALGDFLCRLVSNPARRKTLVLIVEDLHWIDEGSQLMLQGLIEGMDGTPTLVLVNYRPEHTPAWKDSPVFEAVELQPLDLHDTAQLLRDIAGEHPSLDGVDEPIHERTGGNPFFIEEIIRELAEAGYLEGERGVYRLARPIEDAGVPISVQAVLAARIDRLDPAAKQLLQVASVVGKEVSEEALRLTTGAGETELGSTLGGLIDAGFLYESEIYPQRRFAFRHPLTREVAYGTQLASQREATHAAAARAMIELIPPERHDERAAQIADHLKQGGETLEAARWSARAAHWAGHSRPRDAMRLWHETMELAGRLEVNEESDALGIASRLAQIQFAWRVGMDLEEQAQLLDEAEVIADRRDDLHSKVLLRMSHSGRPGLQLHTDEWLEQVKEMSRMSDEAGDPHLQVAIRAAGAYAYLIAADFAGFESALDEIVELADGDITIGSGIILNTPLAWAEMGKGMAEREQGDLEGAEKHFERALEIAAEAGDPETASWVRSNQAGLMALRGDFEGALSVARRNCELTERIGDVFSRSLAIANLAWAQMASEEYQEALDSIEEADRTYREAMKIGGEMEAWRSQLRANALIGVGRTEEAVTEAEWAVRVSRERGLRWSLPIALLALGRARHAAGIDSVEAALDEALDVARETNALTCVLEIEAEREALASAAG